MDWSWQWRRPLRTSREQNMVQALHNALPRLLDNSESDKWVWKLNGSSVFQVSKLRKLIDHAILPTGTNTKTRWNSLVPKKVNIFIWRLRLDVIPMLINLFAKGIDVDVFRCPQCETGVEWTGHTFQRCKFFVETRKFLNSWIKLTIPVASPVSVLDWCDQLKLPVKIRLRIEGILYTWWWYAWKARNNKLHNDIQESSLDIFSAIVSLSFQWVTNRGKKWKTSWDDWKEYPLRDT